MENLEQDLKNLLKWQQIKDELQRKYVKIETAFGAIDVNETGFIELDDLEKELVNYHQIEDKAVIEQIFNLLNAGKDTEQISIEEFGDMWIQVERIIQDVENRIEIWQQVKTGNIQEEDNQQLYQGSANLKSLAEALEKKSQQGSPQNIRNSYIKEWDPSGDLKQINQRVSRIEYNTPSKVYFPAQSRPTFLGKVSSITPPKRNTQPTQRYVKPAPVEIKRDHKAQTLRNSLKSYMSVVGLGDPKQSYTYSEPIKTYPSQQSLRTLSNFNFLSYPARQVSPQIVQPIIRTVQTSGLNLILNNPDFKTLNYRTNNGDRSRQRLIKAKSLSRSQDRLVLLNQQYKLQVLKFQYQTVKTEISSSRGLSRRLF